MSVPAPKPTILIVEDEVGPRNALQVILRPFYNLKLVDSGRAAMQALKEHRIDLITLDMKLPDRHGLDVLQQIKTDHHDIEVIVITGYGSLQSAMDAIRYGATHYLLKPFNVTELLAIITQSLDKKHRLEVLRDALKPCHGSWKTDDEVGAAWGRIAERYERIRPKTKPELSPASDKTRLLAELLEAYDRQLFNHSNRTSFYAALMGNALSLTDAERRSLALGAFLHDIGVIASEGPFSLHRSSDQQDERQHAEIGARLVHPLGFSAEVGQIILYHHERYDGSGYPYGLQGEGIPLLARIVTIAQAFDHLTAHDGGRSYSVEESVQHITGLAGTRYDPILVKVLAQAAHECATSLPALAASARQTLIPEL